MYEVSLSPWFYYFLVVLAISLGLIGAQRNMPEDITSVNYNKISRIYDTSRVAHAETIDKLVGLLHIGRDSVVLDMGCGTGNYSGAIQQVAVSAIGIDLSIRMLEQARAKFSDLSLVHGNVTSIPFKSETFDAAFAIQVLHHVKDKRLFLREAYRVLKKGAYLAIDSCSHRQMRTFWLYYYFPKGLDIDLIRIPDTNEIASLLERTGFYNVSSEISYTDIAFEHEKPEHYLDKNYRDGQSTFCLLTEEDIESGCTKLREDIASGAVEAVIRQFAVKEARVGGSCITYGRKMG